MKQEFALAHHKTTLLTFIKQVEVSWVVLEGVERKLGFRVWSVLITAGADER